MSLVEVFVAMIILSTALIAGSSLLVRTAQIERLAATRREMVDVSQAKLEQLRAVADARTADTLQLAFGGSLTTDVANHNDEVAAPSGLQYKLRWAVAAGPGETRHVILRVSPISAGAHGVLRELDTHTYIMILR